MNEGEYMRKPLTGRQIDHLQALRDGGWHKEDRPRTSASCYTALYRKGFASMRVSSPLMWKITPEGLAVLRGFPQPEAATNITENITIPESAALVARLRNTWSTTAEQKQAADVIEALVKALTDLSNMYASTWDRVGGGLLMMDSGVERFEKAHNAAHELLCRLGGKPLPFNADDDDQEDDQP